MFVFHSLFGDSAVMTDPRNLTHPFSILLSAPSQSGKSHWILKLIEKCQTKVTPPIDRIIYVNSTVSQDFEDRLVQHSSVPVRLTDNIESVRGDPNLNTLVVIDDLMDDDSTEKEVERMFIKRVHHENLSVAYLVQNLFHASKVHRTISLNANYLWLGTNRRAADQIRTLAQQLFPTKTKYFLEAYHDAITRKPYGYLFVDLKVNTPEEYRVKTDVLTDAPICYLHKDGDRSRTR